MKKQPQITEQTKLALKTAFWELYTQKPLEKITIKDITDTAGYNRGTFYLYYKDVYDIFTQVKDELLDKIEAVIQESLRKNDKFDLSEQMAVLVELMHTYKHYGIVLLSDRGDPRFTARLKEIIWPLLDRYFITSQGCNEYQMKILSEFYLSGIIAAVTKWNADPQMSIDQFISFLVEKVFSGVSH